MSSIILEAKSLTKEYKQTLALDHINLQIKKGKIYGFIGQNGAGKTTFLRLVTGLAFPTSGTLSLWGNSGTEELQKQRKRIGSMIETPALFPSMTAYQNMEVQRIQRGIPDKSVIAIKTTDVQKTVLVLEENLHTDNFKLMPDGIIRLYDYLNDLETVASALAESHILVTGLSVSGDTLEDYFLSKIGGTKDVKSPKN